MTDGKTADKPSSGLVPDPSTLLPPDEPIQILDDDGRINAVDGYPIDDLDDEDFRALYRHMVVARRIDKQAINLQRQGQLGVYASLLGQEAAQIGGAYALAPQDWVFPSYREMGTALVRGVNPGQMLHQWRGTWLSGYDPYEFRFGLLSIPIGTQALHGTGFAMAAKFDGSDAVVMAYFGDGATSEGDPHEGMNFAAVFEAPVVFFVQNNQYAISTPLSEQTKAPTIAHKAVGYGMPGLRCDGNDVLASYAVTKRAVERARSGGGPSLIEAVTYRMEAHTTADDPTRYRSAEEMEEWQRRDPIARFETFMKANGLLDDTIKTEIDNEVEKLARIMREEIYEAPHGDPMELFEHVYVDPGSMFDEQREMLRRELDAAAETPQES
ncbi:MAG: pyruvate dehydrogenase (acetyl-transferring) E1 component subunit alpha [Actinomycetota bacterium]|uniref:pyruvate dehydrogenase (acetyl-transferring) E1 component subunit alpha n=1 Tax=Euzebya pacifica TaxID=1608957 RepID=UPI0030F70232